MIQKALEYLMNLNKTEIRDIKGCSYFMNSHGVSRIAQPKFDTVNVTTLSGIVDYLTKDVDTVDSLQSCFIHIESPTSVSLLSNTTSPDRQLFVHATPLLPKIPFGMFLDAEEFNILLQSAFLSTPSREAILHCVGNIREENVRTLADDGVTQEVTVKAGIARNENLIVPNPVTLKPFRTFQDIEQVESKFVFRMKDGGKCGLFEADGGMWRNNAMLAIKEYFIEMIDEVTIIA